VIFVSRSSVYNNCERAQYVFSSKHLKWERLPKMERTIFIPDNVLLILTENKTKLPVVDIVGIISNNKNRKISSLELSLLGPY